MANSAGLVNGDGWISDESDFYGDEEIKSELERMTKRRLEEPYNPFSEVMAKRIKLDPSTKSKQNEDVLDFLKSRPQVAERAALDKSTADRRKTAQLRSGRTATDEAADLLRSDRFEGHPGAKQKDESIEEFLKRLPVADPSTAAVGPWLWISNPHPSKSQIAHEDKEDIESFIEAGEALLEAFLQRKSKTEAENPGKAVATITRYMRPYRDQLEEDILRAAVDSGATCGKWMLFPDSSDLPRYWRVVAEATSQGKFGPVSKVGTYDPFDTKDATLICVYTYDFTDLKDVRRVLDQLLELDLVTKDGKPIYYKCDAYTYLNITSDNSYKLRASLFSSKEIFGNEAKVLQEGPIARLKKRSKTIDSFFSS